MIQTSKRGQRRRIARKRQDAFAPPKYSETHPLGNRKTRRFQAKLDRTLLVRESKLGFQRHLKNLRDARMEGYKVRMKRIALRKAKREKVA